MTTLPKRVLQIRKAIDCREVRSSTRREVIAAEKPLGPGDRIVIEFQGPMVLRQAGRGLALEKVRCMSHRCAGAHQCCDRRSLCEHRIARASLSCLFDMQLNAVWALRSQRNGHSYQLLV